MSFLTSIFVINVGRIDKAYKTDRQRHFSNESGAVLALSGTGAVVSVIPKTVPWHQRLDKSRSPLGASQPKKKLHWRRQYHVFAESQYHSTKRSDPKNGVKKQDDVQSVHRPSIVTIR